MFAINAYLSQLKYTLCINFHHTRLRYTRWPAAPSLPAVTADRGGHSKARAASLNTLSKGILILTNDSLQWFASLVTEWQI